ncbi:MAG: spermidine synthase [Phycisphaerae bacterium]
MTDSVEAAPQPVVSAPRAAGILVYAAAVFAGAFLVFLVQPLIGKYILPWFGGSPAVWSTCLLFFQLLLLAGYAYAHLLTTRLRPTGQAVVHTVLLAAALAALPIIPAEHWKPGPDDDPSVRILLLLATTLGVPYAALAATGPLLQAWFAAARPGVSPYRLYALSNVGSLLALLCYPTLIEPFLTRRQQAWAWSIGLAVFAVLCAACAWQFRRAARFAPPARPATPAVAAGSRERRPVFRWLALPACATALLLAVTNQLTQNVAPIPFLWVLPLAIYLLTFVVCFDSPRWYVRPLFALGLLVTTVYACRMVGLAYYDLTLGSQVVGYGAFLLAACIVCHGELYRLRPDPASGLLTRYYLMIAAGGAAGGLFVALIAPRVFTDYYEFHIAAVACAALAAWQFRDLAPFVPARRGWPRTAAHAMMALAVVGLAFLLTRSALRTHRADVAVARNFYGTLAVYPMTRAGGAELLVMRHGTVPHGAQFTDPARRRQPTTYYGPDTGVGRAIVALRGDRATPLHVGVVGLGVGTLAAYGQAGDRFRFYEINPAVRRLAEAYFTFLADTPATVTHVAGDARLTLDREPGGQQFDLLVLDAFNGDAVPTHLLTREAVVLYARHLRAGGVLAVHVSNAFLDLEPVVARLAADAGFHAVIFVPDDKAVDVAGGNDPADWVILTTDPALLAHPKLREGSRPATAGRRDVRWTDDFSALFPVLR